MTPADILLAAIALTVLATAAWGLINAARIGVLVVEKRHWKRRAQMMTREVIDWQERAEAQGWLNPQDSRLAMLREERRL